MQITYLYATSNLRILEFKPVNSFSALLPLMLTPSISWLEGDQVSLKEHFPPYQERGTRDSNALRDWINPC